MLTIKQQAEISYKCIELKDVIFLVDLMNELERLSAEQQARDFILSLPCEDNCKYKSFIETKTNFNVIDATTVLNVLKQIGFVSTQEFCADSIVLEHKRHD